MDADAPQAAARTALACLDLTSLNDADTAAVLGSGRRAGDPSAY